MTRRLAFLVAALLLAALATGGVLEVHAEHLDSGHAPLARELDLAARHPQSPLHLERSAVERERACAACEKEQRGLGDASPRAGSGAHAGAPERPHSYLPPRRQEALLGTSPGRAPPRI